MPSVATRKENARLNDYRLGLIHLEKSFELLRLNCLFLYMHNYI